MATKHKYQISRTLDERIKRIFSVQDNESEFYQATSGYILGSICGNTTNYVGLTRDYQLYNAGLQIVGLVYFKISPDIELIKSNLVSVNEYLESEHGFSTSDKSQDFLIYSLNLDSREVEKKIFNNKSFIEPQPKLSILDESKIYNHSALVQLNYSFKLNICDTKGLIITKDKIKQHLDDLKKALTYGTKDVKIHLKNSNLSLSSSCSDRTPTESIYDSLDIPADVEQMGDYLPQMTKEDKKKLGDKWRNKMKSQRAPIEFDLEHDNLSFDQSSDLSKEQYGLKATTFLYLNVNDTLQKSIQAILFTLRHNIDLLKEVLGDRTGTEIEPEAIKFCTFKPFYLGHLVQASYIIPTHNPNFELLKNLRHKLHVNYITPLDKPQFRYSQRIKNLTLSNQDQQNGYLCNVHQGVLDQSRTKNGTRTVIKGTYTYHHYRQDRIQDDGWGCAYRSLQTIISWFKHQAYIYSPDVEIRGPEVADRMSSLRKQLHNDSRVPTHEEIQSVLVDVGDKAASFVGSREWIGSQEVCYVLNHLYNLDSRFISVSSASELIYKARDLESHFVSQSTPIMIGGGVLAHTIIGLDFNDKNGDISYLILDPHYTGAEDLANITKTKNGGCGWKKNDFWDKNAFYNLCLPQRPVDF